MDPLQALTAALSVPADSKEQAELLAALRETLEAQPHPIPVLCNTLLKTVAGSNDSLLRRWVLELLHFGIARAPLSVDARTNRACSLSLSLFFGVAHIVTCAPGRIPTPPPNFFSLSML
jgi:symplekin